MRGPIVRKRTLPLLLLLGLAYAVYRLPAWSRVWIETGLTRAFQREASVGAVRIRFFPPEAEIEGVRVAGARPGAAPFLDVERVVVTPGLAPRLDGRVVLARVELARPVIRINAWAEGGDDIPRLGVGSGAGVELRVRRLQILDGALVVNHRRVPLVADLPDFSGRLSQRRGGVLGGRLSFAPGRLRLGELPELPVGTDVELELDGVEIDVTKAHLRARNTDLAYRGKVRLRGEPALDVEMDGRVDLGVLDRHVVPTGFELGGAASFQGRVALDHSQLLVKGELRGEAGVFDGVPVPRFRGQVEKDARGVWIRGLEAELLDGRGRFDIDVPARRGPVGLRASLDAVDLEGALRAIFDYGPLGVGSLASGTLGLVWPRGEPRLLSGRIALALAARDDGDRAPLEGRFRWNAQQGMQQVEGAELRTPSLEARLQGRVDTELRADLELDAASGELASADRLLAGLRRGLGNADALAVGVAGSGRFRGRWRGRLGEPLFEGRFSGEALRYLDVDWGRCEWAGSLDAAEIRSHSLVLRKGEAELWLDGRSETGSLGAADGIQARIRLRGWPASDLARALEWDVDVQGPLSGEVELDGRRSAPFGSAHLTAPAGRYYGVPFEDLELRSVLQGRLTRVEFGRAGVGGGRMRFRGSLSDEDAYDGLAELEDVAIDELLPRVSDEARLGGRVSGELRLQGPLLRPRLEARLASTRLFLGDEGLGALELVATGDGDGRVAFDGRLSSPRLDLRGSGQVDVAAPHAAVLKLEVRDTSVDPYLRALAPALPAAAGILVAGEGHLAGPLARPAELEGELLVNQIELPLPDYPVKGAEPLLVRIADGRARFSELRLVGEGTSLSLRGGLGLRAEQPLAVDITGDADLQALSAVTRRVRGRGAARLAVSISGTRAAPRLQGRLELEGAGVRVRGFPQGLDDVRGALVFDEGAALFEGVTGRFGGGEVELQGRVAYAAGRLGSFEIRGGGRGVSLRYPEGLRALFDADVRLFGDAQTQWIAGDVEVRQARWTRRYDVASELLGAARPSEAALPLRSGVRYDLRLRAPGTLSVDNNLASLQGSAELRLVGGYEQPVLLGRAEIQRGRVYFQGTTYVIRRGTVDFTNPQAIDPVFNIEAEARVRSYRVTLKVSGTLERVYPSLTSDPPLSAVQILNLLAGADETAVSSLQVAQSDTSRLAATGAATLAAGRLAEEVGLERGAERLLGLSRFSIDPSIVRAGISDPTARLTLGKRVQDLSVLYSVDLRGTDERLLSIEYILSDRLSILLTQAVPGGVGLDVRLRHTR
jgi:autotransporter translocation and assembly factor TamB